MSERRYRNLSLRGPVTLFIVVLVLIVTLTVLWNVVLVHDYTQLRQLAAQGAAFHWTFIALGSALFVTIIILASLLGAQLIAHIRWSQRQSNFMASVSHELNSPLSSIKLFAQTLRKPDLSTADRRNFVDKILFDVERLSRLIANILRAAEVDNRGEELLVDLHAVELFSYLAEYQEDARTLNAGKHLEISLSGEEDVWVDLDRMMFRQVLDNLIDNAIRYRGSGPPKVKIELLRGEGAVEIWVKDQGIGVAPGELARLFERFYRSESPSKPRPQKGTGIGLYVVRTIVQAHGGKVGATSAGPGHGMTVWIRLPTRAREAAERLAVAS